MIDERMDQLETGLNDLMSHRAVVAVNDWYVLFNGVNGRDTSNYVRELVHQGNDVHILAREVSQ